MEENNTTTENNKPSYEQLKRIALQLNQRALQAEAELGAINLTTMRLEYLFKVLERTGLFPEQFVDNCVAEIIDIMKVKEEKEKEDDSFIDSPKE